MASDAGAGAAVTSPVWRPDLIITSTKGHDDDNDPHSASSSMSSVDDHEDSRRPPYSSTPSKGMKMISIVEVLQEGGRSSPPPLDHDLDHDLSSATEGSGSYASSFSSSCDAPTPTTRIPTTTINFFEKKTFNDMIHPHLDLPHICYRIINTPQFQRLRNLKQLGLCYFVYPSACHNRFEHCIGTSHVAGKYCKILAKTQPELLIDSKDILCIYIAGLCHDIGHGPFSHSWEHFMRGFYEDYSHEKMSLQMLDDLLDSNDLWSVCTSQYGLNDVDRVFIKELILGRPLDKSSGCQFKGRRGNKHFLYQIVANSMTSIDVDKFDYILRDCKHLGITTAFDYERVLDNSRVFFIQESDTRNDTIPTMDQGEGTTSVIAYRKKIADNLEDLFRGRASLHRKAYQHKVTKIVEEMVMDGLKAAEPFFKIPCDDKPGTYHRLSNAHFSSSSFMKLTDSVFEQIVHWGNGGKRAKRIFDDILTRNLYKCLGYLIQDDSIDKKLLQTLSNISPSVVLIRTHIHAGKGTENPLNSALFYEKNKPGILTKGKFPKAEVERKIYIVLRPTYTYSCDGEDNDNQNHDLSDDEEKELLNKLETQVGKVLQQFGIMLEGE